MADLVFSSGDPWPVWNITLANNTCVTTTTDIAWTLWTGTSSATSITITDCTWTSWAAETTEQRAAREEANATRIRVREEARSRAEALLLATLNDAQRREYTQHKHFHVRGRSGRRFRIDCGRAHNVFTINERGVAVVEHCAHVGEFVPDEDNILAQKFMLEHDEERFLRTANSRTLVRA